MPKYQRFFKKIAKFRSDMRYSANSDSVKDLIGDSTQNNRTVTVNQVHRYLVQTGQVTNAERLAATYEVLRPIIKSTRLYDGCQRTDAIDIDEFVRVYRHEVMDTKNQRKKISTVLRGT